MREYDTVPVVVLDVVENTLAGLLIKIVFPGIEYLSIRISFPKSVGNVEYICFQSDNHRLVCQSQSFHLVGSRTHDERLAGTHLVVTYTTAIGFEHPYRILLTFVEVGYAQPFQVKVGKSLMRAVKVGTHKTVEKTIVTVGELLLERVWCASEPIDKALPDFLYLGICHLDSMSVPYFDSFRLSRNLVRHLFALVDVWNGIV